jgi:hypothetical protein
MKKLVLEFSKPLEKFCKQEGFTYRLSIYDGNKFIIIELFEDGFAPDISYYFELGLRFAEFKNSI